MTWDAPKGASPDNAGHEDEAADVQENDDAAAAADPNDFDVRWASHHHLVLKAMFGR